MERKQIYFFSGAGHSFAVARDLATELGDTKLTNMASEFGKEEDISDDSSLICFVFPVYGGLPPKIIRQWLAHFIPGENTVIAAVCTCGLAPGHSLLRFDEILRESGSQLTWGFTIRQPQSGIGSKRINTPDRVETLLMEQKEKVRYISHYIRENQRPCIEKSGRLSEFFNSETLKTLPTIGKLIYQLIIKGIKNMKFHPGSDCDGCGVCARLCPVGNIVISEGLPSWEDNCVGCMGCYHWCPKDAVENVDLDMIQSPHREVRVSELLAYSSR